jgi:hypothetical protein
MENFITREEILALPRNGKGQIILDLKTFESIYYNYTNKEIAKMCDINRLSLAKYIKQAGIKRKPRGRSARIVLN